ncbi:MAG: flagellar motor switch protein FliG [Anaerolineales bacterium]|nr:flagellar motor switch protein FliG [Anaerolineales bacterium]
MAEIATTQLTGLQKAATLLVTLGVDRSSAVLQNLGEVDLERVLLAISEVGAVPVDVRYTVLHEAHELTLVGESMMAGGIEYTRQLLARAVGPRRGAEILERLAAHRQRSSFEILRDADPAQVATLLSDEHPQTIAVVLSYLEAKQAATILSNMSSDLQADVTLRLAQMERIPPQVVEQVERGLKRKLSGVLSEADYKATGGVNFLVKVLNQVDRGVQKTIFDALEANNPPLAEEVRANMFTFDDLIKLNDRAMQRVLRDVNKTDLTLALKGAPEKIKDLVMRNMSERGREMLKEELELLGPQLAKNVYGAQRKIVDVVRSLEASEEIVIAGGGGGNEFIA